MKTQTKVVIKGNDLLLHLNENKLITFKGVTDAKQIPEYMVTNLNYLINSFNIDNHVSIKVEKEKFPFTGWTIYLESANLSLTDLRIYYRNDTRKAILNGIINGYLLYYHQSQSYKQTIKNLQKHVLAIF